MTMRLVQQGQGDGRDFVVIYHLTSQLDQVIKDAFGPAPCIVNVTEEAGKSKYSAVGVGKLRTVDQLMLDAHVTRGGRVVLIGFSEGCAGVRAQLKAGVYPDAVVAIDGTHSTLPVNPVDVSVWARPFEGARLGTGVFVGTHSGLTYVETLKAPHVPYACTHHVLELVTGWTLPLPRGEDVVRSEGNAHIISNGDGWDIDPKAHIRQATEVLPRVIRDFIAPWLASNRVDPIPPTEPHPSTTLGSRCVEWALAQVGKHGLPPGSHESPDIKEWRSRCLRGDGGSAVKLNLPPTNWCAIFACAAVYAVIDDGVPWPHGYRAGVVELVADTSTSKAGYTGTWVPVAVVRQGEYIPQTGDLAVYDRSQPGKPETAWWRHVNRVVKYDKSSESYKTVGGNEVGDAVCLGIHKVSDSSLLGFISYPGVGVSSDLSDEDRERIDQNLAMFQRECLDQYAADNWGRNPSGDAQDS